MRHTWLVWPIVIAVLACLCVGDAQARRDLDLTGRLGVGNGTAARPSVGFKYDRNNGLYRIGADNIGLSIGGTKRWDFAAATSTLTGDLVVSGSVTVGSIVGTTTQTWADGSAGTPAIRWTSDTNCGWYRIGADNVGFSAAGSKIIDYSATAVVFTPPLSGAVGSVGAPGYAFTGDLDCGLYRIGANNIGAAVNGAKVLDIGTGGLDVTGTGAFSGVVSFADGAVGAPSITNTGDTNCGIYWSAADNLDVVAAGAVVGNFSASGLAVTGVITLGNGAVGAPAYTFTSDTNLGIYRVAADDMGLVAAGAEVCGINATGLDVTGIVTVDDGAVGAPSVAFGDDTDCGIYRIGTNNVGITVGGTKQVDIDGTDVALTSGLTVTGATALNGGLALDTSVFTIANTTGVISWVPTSTTGDAATLDGTTLTSGTLLKMVAVDATMASGYYMEVLGGTNSTVVWTVGEGGATRITPNVNTIEPLYVDGILTTTADLLTLRADDDILNGGLYIECLGGSSYDTTQFSVAEGGVVTALGDSTFTGGLNTGTGYSGTGATISAAGAGQFDAAITTGAGVTAATACAFNAGFSMDSTVFVLTDATGAISWVPTNTTGDAMLADGITTTSGTILKMRADDDVLASGFYLEILGGASYDTEVFSIAEDGATAITSTQVATNSFSITNNATTSGDLITLTADDDTLDGDTYYITALGGTDHATAIWSVGEGGATLITPSAATIVPFYIDGTLTTSADLVTLKAVDATLNGGMYLECLGGNGSASVLSIGEDGATTITSTVAATNSLSIVNNASTSGDLLTLTGDDDNLDNDTFYVIAMGGTSSSTEVWSIGQGGIEEFNPTAEAAALNTVTVSSILVTTGVPVYIEVDDDVLDGGNIFQIDGGSSHDTDQFHVAEGGVVYTLGKVTATGGLDTGTGYSGTGATVTAAGAASFDSTITAAGAATFPVLATETVSGNSDTITSANYGTTIFYTQAGAVAVTLPAAGEPIGSWFRCVNANSDTTAPTYSTPVADNLVTFNNASADSVTFGAGHRIGSSVLFISNGSFWVVWNESASNTMTVTDA